MMFQLKLPLLPVLLVLTLLLEWMLLLYSLQLDQLGQKLVLLLNMNLDQQLKLGEIVVKEWEGMVQMPLAN